MSTNESPSERTRSAHGPAGPTRSQYRAVDTNGGETLLYDVDRQEAWIQSDETIHIQP